MHIFQFTRSTLWGELLKWEQLFWGEILWRGAIFRGQLSGWQSSRGQLSGRGGDNYPGGNFLRGAVFIEPQIYYSLQVGKKFEILLYHISLIECIMQTEAAAEMCSLKSRSNHQRYSIIKGVLRNFAKFTGKHLCQSPFFNKVADLRLLWSFCNSSSLK